jgi:RNA polymerase sigma-70 factor (ECF subfamily)
VPGDADDLEAIRAVLEGDEAAFRLLVEKYSSSIVNLAYRMTGSSVEAEDLAQDAFLQAYANLADFRVGARFHPWLYTIALNLCRNHLRRKALVRWISLEDGAPDASLSRDVHGTAPNPEQALLARESEERLHKAIQELPTKYREVFVLRQSEGLSYEEIAQITALPLGTVEVRLFRARQRLLKALGADGWRRTK